MRLVFVSISSLTGMKTVYTFLKNCDVFNAIMIYGTLLRYSLSLIDIELPQLKAPYNAHVAP